MPWTRHGECNHCGWCCETLSHVFFERTPMDAQWAEFYKARGFETYRQGRAVGRFGWLLAPCPQHVEDRCALGDAKPVRCVEFPTNASQIVGSPCSYWFEWTDDGPEPHAARRILGGMGSPHPCDEKQLLAIEVEEGW